MSNTYSKEERLEALKLADEIGPVATAQRLNINLNTLYNWQSKARKQGIWSYVKKKYKLNVTNFHILRASFNSPFSTHLLPFF